MYHPLVLALLLLSLQGCVDRTGQQDSDGDATGSTSATSSTDPTDPTEGTKENPNGPCNPTKADADCPGDYVCCSDDPATSRGRLPNYVTLLDNDKYGPPLFSADNNAFSHSGQCVELGFPTPLTNGCPVPCNPTWSAQAVAEICGAGVICRPFTAIDPEKDCVIDPDTGRWRAVRGTDIGSPLSTWGPQHATNQDPNGSSCAAVVGTDPDALGDCYDQLSVADQRGFCYVEGPCVEDLCDMKNPGWTPRCS